ncbi:MAG: hypothetical protein COX70_01450 [Flavobacteriales bacterium CG_4_10_14_0_2_um_filter_32_8]|nr:MAG: hypothetical protein COX70_01450 [Flavobacteriales bacterium CG_4_10_14_0_2_um_filter_32_8]
MKKLKITSIVIGAIVVILVATGIIFSTIYEDKVKAYIIEQINNSVNTKIDVKEVNFSVFKKFPYASLEFKEVTAEEVTKNEKKGTLFSAQSIYLQFNIIDIIKENYIIKKVQVEDGIVNIKIDRFGNDNYHFWKTTTSEPEKKLSIELEKLTFQHVNFYLLNDYKVLDMDIEAVDVALSGNFSSDEFTLNTKAHLLVNQINEHKQSIIKNKNMNINTSLAVNQKKRLYHIKKGEVAIENMKFVLLGNIKNQEVGIHLDIHSKGNELELKELVSLLPTQQKEAISAYETQGKITFACIIKGELSIKKSPLFEAEFTIKNGTITEKSSSKSLTNVILSGNFTNGKDNNSNTSRLTLNPFDANFGAGHISGKYVITNFSNPFIEFDSKATIDIATAKEFFKLDTLELANGTVELNLNYSGYIKELHNIKASELRKLNANGTARLSGVNLKLINNPKTINNINGSFIFNNNDVQVDTLNFNINKSDFELDGKFKNLLAYLFIEGEYLAVQTNFHSNNLVLDELLMANSESKNEKIYTFNLPQNIHLNFNAKVDTFQFRKFFATQFRGTIQLEDKIVTATDVSFNAMKGKVNGNIAIDDSKENEVLITSKAEVIGIDIRELFNQFENFGQTHINAENIKGTTTTKIEFASVWDKQLNVNKDKIYVLADVNISRGELINYQPLLALSKYIELEELKNVKFNTLTTHIEIKNQTVYIPKTEIKSSALDLTISGTHTFNNEIDYRFKLLMSDVLWKKAKATKKENSEFGYEADDGLGKTTLFLHMTGTVSNYKISYDTKGLKESFVEDLKKEKNTLKSILKEEFGWFKKDSTINQNNPSADGPKGDGFELEWEEEKDSKSPNDNKKDNKKQDKKIEKKGLGKFIDKVAQPDQKEYEEGDDF